MCITCGAKSFKNVKTLLTFLLFLTLTNASAEIVQVNDSTGTTIPLTPNPGPHKAPVATVVVEQDGNDLIFPSWCESCMVCLADEDDIVFTGYVGTDGTIMLPTTLSGTYTLILYVDDIIYYGDLEL